MYKSFVKARNRAFQNQGGVCWYCAYPMWRRSPARFSLRQGISPEQAARFRCTAEHLIARREGGKHAGNIVAACLYCNQQRHRPNPKRAPIAEAYRAHVQMRVAAGTWHPVANPNRHHRKAPVPIPMQTWVVDETSAT